MASSSTSPRLQEAPQAHTFYTSVNGCVRTAGCAIVGYPHSASDLQGLDVELLAEAAVGTPDAAARGKLAIVGRDGACVFQTAQGATSAMVWCGHATAPVALLLSHLTLQKAGSIRLLGPGGKEAGVTFTTTRATVRQVWTLPPVSYTQDSWRDRTVFRCAALNPYAVVPGPLPEAVTPEMALRELVGCELGAKLAIVTRAAGSTEVGFYNAGGAHGAAPMTGLATLAILARLSSSLADFIPDGTITYATKNGPVTTQLTDIATNADGSVKITMPTVDVHLSPISFGNAK